MSIVPSLIAAFNSVLDLTEDVKVAEKGKVPAIKNDARTNFKKHYDEYVKLQSRTNSLHPDNRGHAELSVLLCEAAFATESYDICRGSLEKFLFSVPQKDQFYCRAKLLMGKLLNLDALGSQGTENIEKHKTALANVMECLTVALAPDNLSRYKFLVFNASVIGWHIIHQFLRPNRAKLFLGEIQKIVNALEVVEDPDTDWYIMYCSAAAYCLNDDKQVKPATDMVDKAIDQLEKLIQKAQSNEDCVQDELRRVTKESEELVIAIHRIESGESTATKPAKDDKSRQPATHPNATNKQLDENDHTKLRDMRYKLDSAQAAKVDLSAKLRAAAEEKSPLIEQFSRLNMQKISISAAEIKKAAGNAIIAKNIRASVLLQLQQFASMSPQEREKEKDQQAPFLAMIAQLDAAPDASGVAETLLDVSRMAWSLGYKDIALRSMDLSSKNKVVSPVIRVKLDTCLALQIVDSIKADNTRDDEEARTRLSMREMEGYQVSRRIEAVKLMERVLTLCTTRVNDAAFTEEAVTLLWNMAIPLMQPHLRGNLHSALRVAANALETISSRLVLLRAQLHFELAKCEEKGDFLIPGKHELEKALSVDYGTIEAEQGQAGRPPSGSAVKGKKAAAASSTGSFDSMKRTDELNPLRRLDHHIQPMLQSLTLRADVFGESSVPEDVVASILQQVKESPSRAFQADAILRAATLLIDTIDGNVTEVKHEKGIKRKKSLAANIGVTDIEAFLTKSAILNAGSSYEPFRKLTQRRISYAFQLIKAALVHKNTIIVEWMAKYILSFVWNENDPFVRDFLCIQIETCQALAEVLILHLSLLWLPHDKVSAYTDAVKASSPSDEPDPRALGITTQFSTPDMLFLKRLVILALHTGLRIANVIADEILVQNTFIYFWNLHLHIFRKSYYSICLPELLEFVKYSCTSIETLATTNKSSVDERLAAAMYEILACFYEEEGKLQQALDSAVKGTIKGSVYSKKRNCVLANRLNLQLLGTSGKGKGAGAGKVVDAVKCDHPILTVLGMLFLAESDETPVDQRRSLAGKITALMEGEVKTVVAAVDLSALSSDEFNQSAELQAECWTRLTRLRIQLADVHGAQQSAEQCMQLVTSSLVSDNDKQQLNSRVLRWISVCERYFGIAISQLLKAEGQEKRLQNELRLAALRHFTLAVHFGLRAQLDDLIVAGARRAWDVSAPMVSDPTVRSSLFGLQKQIVDALSSSHSDDVGILLQQFYMAMVEGQIQNALWDDAMQTVFEAFDRVPVSYQKPLWKCRVIILSKKGKNVLEGIHKLKESDASLQARVFALVARSSSQPKQQLEAYSKALELMKGDLDRMEYMLETALWICSSGLPKEAAYELLQGCVDAAYECEEVPEPVEEEDDVDEGSSQAGSRISAGSLQSSATRQSVQSKNTTNPVKAVNNARTTTSTAGSVSGGMTSPKRKSKKKAADFVEQAGQSTLSLKQLSMTTQAVVMLAMLEHDATRRTERCLEAVSLIIRCMTHWTSSVQESHRNAQYAALPIAVREQTPIESFECESAKSLIFPSDPLDFIYWEPSTEFMEAMRDCVSSAPYKVPSPISIPYVALTCYYTRWLASALYESGYIKQTVLCHSWTRSLLMFIDCPGREYALGALHYKAFCILTDCGLPDIAKKLPTRLGLTNIDCPTLISNLCTPSSLDNTPLSVDDDPQPRTAFSILTWTPVLHGIDRTDYSIDISAELIKLGMHSVARLILAHLKKGCVASNDTRALVRITSLLIKTDELLGRPEVIVSQVLSLETPLTKVGDVSLLSKLIISLSQSYMNLQQLSQAQDILLKTIGLVEDILTIHVPTPRKKGSTDSRAHSKMHTSVTLRATSRLSTGASALAQPSSSTLRTTVDGSIDTPAPVESSYDAAVALTRLTTAYVDTLLSEARLVVMRDDDLRPAIEKIESFFRSKVTCTESVIGYAAVALAKMLLHKSIAVYNFLRDTHRTSSLAVPINVYIAWLDSAVQRGIRDMEHAADILRGFHVGVPLTDRSYRTVGGEAAPSEDSSNSFHTVSLLATYDRILGTCLYELAVQYSFLTIIRREDITINDASRDEAQSSVIEYYLEGSRARNALVISDFVTPAAFKCIFCAKSGCRVLQAHSTDATEVDAQVEEYKASLMFLSRQGMLDMLWVKPTVTKQVKGTKAQTKQKKDKDAQAVSLTDTIPEDLVRLQFYLTRAFYRTLQAGRLVAASEAALALVNAYGHSNMKLSVLYLLHHQSIRVRDWLLMVWRQALAPSSAVALTLDRILKFEGTLVPTPCDRQTAAVDTASLQSNHVWKRLNVSRFPEDIFPHCGHTCFFSLQFCPSATNCYVAVGCENISGIAVDDKWVIDKLNMFESSRRAVQQLKRQHAVWRADVTKFIGQYGDAFTPDMEEAAEGGGFSFSGFADGLDTDSRSTMKQVEQTLADRLKAQLADLERLFAPLIGPESRAHKWLTTTGAPAADHAPLVLLIDPLLQDLPWEGAEIFSGPFRSRVTRDFSLHMFANRLVTLPPVHGGVGSLSTSRCLHASAVQCVVDPLAEDKGIKMGKYTRPPITESFESLRAALPGGTKWAVHDTPGSLTLQDWISISQKFVTRSESAGAGPKSAKGKHDDSAQLNAALVFHAPGRMGSSLSPKDLSLLNLDTISLVFIADNGYNDVSYRHQTALDIQKRAGDKAGEAPVQYAALLSLTGVPCIVSHMWSTSFSSQQRFMKNFWESFTMTNKGVTVAVELSTLTSRHGSRRTSSRPITPSDSFIAGRQTSPKGTGVAPSPGKPDHPAPQRAPSVRARMSPGGDGRARSPSPGRLEGADGSSVDDFNDTPKPIKKWITLSRVVFGLSAVTYSDA